MRATNSAVGAALDRIEGREKVAGEARYAYEYPVEGVVYAHGVQSTIAKGEIRHVDATAALALPGVLLVLSHENAPRLQTAEAELALFQTARVAYRGQLVAAVVADSYETARHAEQLVQIDYTPEDHDVVLRPDHPAFYKPDRVNPNHPTDTNEGDIEAALAAAEFVVDETYETPATHNNPIEPHATLAIWENGGVTLYDSNQGSDPVREAVAKAFALDPEQVRVIAPHVGGGFGSKGRPRPNVILAVMAAQAVGRPAKVAVTRQQMFAVTGYRTPTIQRLRLGADRNGRLAAIAHDVWEQSSTLVEFAEQTALATRMMYAAPNRQTTHRLVRLDVPTPSWMRAPGECPGMFALESAIDELAIACGLDPVELRVRNEPDVDPQSGNRFSTRNLVACLHEGARRFDWEQREPTPARRLEGRCLVGAGVAASTYPARRRAAEALLRAEPDGSFTISLSAADIGTGARTALTQIAADELEVTTAAVRLELGDTAFPPAGIAGGSMGTSSWGSAVVKACRTFRAEGGSEVRVDTRADVDADESLAKHAFGAQFVEARVNVDTGEVRIPRLLGVFAAGRIVNPKTARSQLIGGMTMGLGMALLEESTIEPRFGGYLNRDLAAYHVPACADVQEVDAVCIEENDPDVNPMGAKGIGEIGIVGTAAAVANAVYDATGVRVRDLPIRPDKLLAQISRR
jgi:xanthine dehydrogenase YagR molybdenum-binding subunit